MVINQDRSRRARESDMEFDNQRCAVALFSPRLISSMTPTMSRLTRVQTEIDPLATLLISPVEQNIYCVKFQTPTLCFADKSHRSEHAVLCSRTGFHW